MDRSSKRGKIPQQDWPSIVSRHEAGETLASIARTYDCSPPAISYIVSRSRARNSAMAAAHTVTGAAEPQLVKVHAAEPSGVPGSLRQPVTTEPPASSAPPFRQQSPHPEPRLFADDASRAADPRNDQRSRENGSSRYYQGQASNESARFASPSPVADDRFPQNGEARRRLHLSLPGNGHDSPHPPQSPDAAPADRYSAQPAYVQ